MKGLFRAATAFFLIASATTTRADVLIDNIVGLSPDENGSVSTFAAVQIGNDGRIVKVWQQSPSRQEQKRKKKRDKQAQQPAIEYRYDGKGRFLIPGLIDSHANIMDLGLALLKAKAGFKGTPTGEPRPEDRDLALNEAQDLLIRQGVTTVTDMGTTIANWQAFRRAGDRGALRLRIVSYAANVPGMLLIGGPGPGPWLYDDKLKFNGLSLMVTEVGHDAKDNGATQLRNLVSRGAIDKFQVAMTAHDPVAVTAALDALDEITQTYKGERRWRIEGLDRVAPNDVPRLQTHGVFASMQPGGLGRAGTDSVNLTAPWRTLQIAGVPVSFGSGSGGTIPRPFADMALAISRQADATVGEAPTDSEALTRQQALSAWTVGGAHALFAEDRLGRIAEGLRADFLLIDRDPLLASPETLRQTQLLEVWIGGQLAWKPDADEAAPAIGR